MDKASEKSETNLFMEFMKHLKDLIEKPPYLMFYFVNSILSMISLIWKEKYFGLFFVLLVYSMIGVVWRHATKDLRGRLKEKYPKKYPNRFNTINLWLTGVYQMINIALVVCLVILLFLFWENRL